MMKQTFVLLALCLAAACDLTGQALNGTCGTTIEDQMQYTERLMDNLARAESGQVSERGAVQYVPVHFHIVGDASGNGKHKENQILDQLCDMNEAYAPMDIRFFLSPHPTYGLFDYTINNDNVYVGQSNTFLMANRRHTGALNIFIVNQAFTGNNVLAYYSPGNDWVVSRKDQVNGTGNGTVPHEVGHFFSLRHTFYGYEDNPFNPNSSGWPVAPIIAPYHPGPNIDILTERQNGSNCANSADLICDTPPDYNFGSLQSGCNPYNGGAKDPLGTLVDPMENNYMSYFFNCGSTYQFTPMQQAAVLADLASPFRNYLDNVFSPIATSITTPPDLLLGPVDADTTDYYDQVLLNWHSVAGANRYLLEIDLNGFYNSPLRQAFIMTDTAKLLNNLSPNKKYFWRVRPFNEYVTCPESREKTFRTSLTSSTHDISELEGWQLAPNPTRGTESVQLFISASESFEAVVQVLDLTGRIVRTMDSQTVNAGENVLELPLYGLSEGLYMVMLQSSRGVASRKLTITR
ncbi:MAG: T9SS type A sorting domain-containing protein [Lewinellaceae bacterium]|nr:T9SS type A sorting domain-containing protein [Lewinellaceae bacterium]